MRDQEMQDQKRSGGKCSTRKCMSWNTSNECNEFHI